MNDFIEKTYNLINFRYLILIFQKYSLTCPKGGQNASLYLEMSQVFTCISKLRARSRAVYPGVDGTSVFSCLVFVLDSLFLLLIDRLIS